MQTISQQSAKRHSVRAAAALLRASASVQAYARAVESREPVASTPFYAAAAWIKTVAVLGGAL